MGYAAFEGPERLRIGEIDLRPFARSNCFNVFCDQFVEPLSQVQLAFKVRDGCWFPAGDQRIELSKLLSGLLLLAVHERRTARLGLLQALVTLRCRTPEGLLRR